MFVLITCRHNRSVVSSRIKSSCPKLNRRTGIRKRYLELVTYVDVIAAQPLQAVRSLVVFPVQNEIRRRLGYKQGPQKEHRGRYCHQEGALPPIQVRAGYVRQQHAHVAQHLQHSRQATPDARHRDFRYVHLEKLVLKRDLLEKTVYTYIYI